MTELARDARESVSRFADPDSAEYKSLLPRLIGQAMAQIVGRGSKVSEVEVRVRSKDVAALVEGGAASGGLKPAVKALVVAEYEDAVRKERAEAMAARAQAESTAESRADAAAAAAASASSAGSAGATAAAATSATAAGEEEEPIAELPDTFVVVRDARLEAEAGRIGGGVIVSASKGRILVDNSLNARVALATHELQHLLRAALFGTR
jgi:hypothetical protein